MLTVDVVLGIQHGDEGKGKVTHHLLRTGDYTHCVRYNGGCNAGHTIYHNGVKFITHHIPAGVFFGIKSIIGPGCVVDIPKFKEEIRMLKEGGIDIEGKIYIARNAHIIQEVHRWRDHSEKRIGTTQTGNGPCYSDKYGRSGQRAFESKELEPYLIDMYEEFYTYHPEAVVLCEGAQGFSLDVDWGDYPYVTSSHCTTAGALLNGFNPKSLRKIYGVAKVYETYVGSKDFQPPYPIFERIQHVGSEFGATTGRKRQCDWVNLETLLKAIKMNGVDHVILNKLDVLEEVDSWVIRLGDSMLAFQNKEQFVDYISQYLNGIEVTFSGSPHEI